MPKTTNKTANRVNTVVSGKTRPKKFRVNVSPSSDQGVAVKCISPFNVSATDAFGFHASSVLVDPPKATDAGGTVLRNYSEYRMEQGALHWTPTVGTTTSGTIWIGYYDNPEIMLKATNGTYSPASMIALAKQAPHRISMTVWMPGTLSLPLFRRRAKFTTDTTSGTTRTDFDLCSHGVFVIGIEGAPVSTNVGYLSLEYRARGYNLENQTITNI